MILTFVQDHGDAGRPELMKSFYRKIVSCSRYNLVAVQKFGCAEDQCFICWLFVSELHDYSVLFSEDTLPW